MIKVPVPNKSLHTLFWNLLTRNNYYEYQIRDKENRPIAFAKTTPKLFYFTFMDKKDYNALHIGPCSTIQEARGKGLYPYLLNYIIENNPNIENFYIFANKNNLSSIKGIEKIKRFKFIGYGYKNTLGYYKLF